MILFTRNIYSASTYSFAKELKNIRVYYSDAELKNYAAARFYMQNPEGWEVIVPARRSDISLEVDLIEEVVRLWL